MISVCMATFNGEKYIKEQVDSILKQLGSEDEIVVSDDGSSDNTIKILKSYNDSRIKIFNHQGKINPVYSFNHVGNVMYNFENALKNAKGDYIFLSDQDDVWCDNKVKLCVEGLKDNALVLTNFSITDEKLNVLQEKYYTKCPASKSNFKNILTPPFAGCVMAFRKETLEKILPFPDSVWLHDLWIGLVINKYWNVGFIDEPLILHRLNESNTSTWGRKKSNNSLFIKMKYRWCNLVNINRR